MQRRPAGRFGKPKSTKSFCGLQQQVQIHSAWLTSHLITLETRRINGSVAVLAFKPFDRRSANRTRFPQKG
jgi:hypothetical protein